MCKKIIVALSLLTSFVVGAQAPLVINDHVNETIFELNQLEYFIDSANRFSVEQVSSKGFQSGFRKHYEYQNTDFRTGSSYWIRFPVMLTSPTHKTWFIEFYDQSIDVLEVYMPNDDGSYAKHLMGDHFPFAARRFKHKNFEVQLELDPGSTQYYYFRIYSHDFADIRLAVRSADRFIPRANFEYFLYGTLYGMVLIISLYNFLVYLAIREIKNVIYIFYIISVAFYAMSLDGIGFQYLWPNHPEWNDYSAGFFLYAVIFLALVFTRRFLSTKANSPALDRVLKWLIVIRSLLFVIAFIFFNELLTYRTLDIIPLSVIFYTGVRVWKNGYRPARFFVIAYGLLFFGFFIRSLVYFNVIPFNTPSHYSLHFAFVLEMLFLTFALGDRIRILKDMRDRALRRIIHQHEYNMQLKDTVNRELEQKVQERTEELNTKNSQLEESNRKLVKQSFEINQINSILDLDNWKLKNSIKEVLNERLMEKTMDYAQFRTLYPDALACYRFLDSLKWPEGYTCRKCNNEKYFKGSQKFSRRCTRCGYNESITAFTIFHSIKFPIEKAFYIAYLTVTGKKESTLEELASRLELGTNTVWSFRSKVNDRIHDLLGKGKRPLASKWEEVIMDHVKLRGKEIETEIESGKT